MENGQNGFKMDCLAIWKQYLERNIHLNYIEWSKMEENGTENGRNSHKMDFVDNWKQYLERNAFRMLLNGLK